MKTKIIKLTLFFAGCALAGPFPLLTAQSYDPWKGLFDQANAEVQNAATTPTGSLILVGDVATSNPNIWDAAAWESTDAGATWATVDQVANGTLLTATSDASLTYAGGTANSDWLVRASSGGAFQDDDVWQYSIGATAVCHGLAIGLDGSVYAVGTANQTKGSPLWIVKKRHGVKDWPVVEAVVGGGVARAAGVDPLTGDVYVVGGFPSKNATMTWTVRRRLANSPDTSWVLVDAYPAAAGPGSQAWGVAFDSSGAIYVTGYAGSSSKGSITVSWVLRRSRDRGASWCNVDLWSYRLGQASFPRGITIDPAGTVYLGGYGYDTGASPPSWIVRRGTPGLYPTDCTAAQSTWRLSEKLPSSTQVNALLSLNYMGTPSVLAVGEDWSDGLFHGVARILSPAP